MYLTQREQEKLVISLTAELARKYRARGLPFNFSETMARLSSEIMKAAREGKSVAQIMTLSAYLLSREDVKEEVAEMVTEVQVEANPPYRQAG